MHFLLQPYDSGKHAFIGRLKQTVSPFEWRLIFLYIHLLFYFFKYLYWKKLYNKRNALYILCLNYLLLCQYSRVNYEINENMSSFFMFPHEYKLAFNLYYLLKGYFKFPRMDSNPDCSDYQSGELPLCYQGHDPAEQVIISYVTTKFLILRIQRQLSYEVSQLAIEWISPNRVLNFI